MESEQAGRIVNVRPLDNESPDAPVVERARQMAERAVERANALDPGWLRRMRSIPPEVAIAMTPAEFEQATCARADEPDAWDVAAYKARIDRLVAEKQAERQERRNGTNGGAQDE